MTRTHLSLQLLEDTFNPLRDPSLLQHPQMAPPQHPLAARPTTDYSTHGLHAYNSAKLTPALIPLDLPCAPAPQQSDDLDLARATWTALTSACMDTAVPDSTHHGFLQAPLPLLPAAEVPARTCGPPAMAAAAEPPGAGPSVAVQAQGAPDQSPPVATPPVHAPGAPALPSMPPWGCCMPMVPQAGWPMMQWMPQLLPWMSYMPASLQPRADAATREAQLQARRQRYNRFREKKSRMATGAPVVKYTQRKKFADTRPRVGGRFIPKSKLPPAPDAASGALPGTPRASRV